jgi:acyl-CoA synthetase (AMP-forming)/AMP-acid ligase II
MLVNELIRRGAQRFPGRPAVIFGDQTLTFADVDTICNRLAAALCRIASLQVGARIGLLVNNCLHTVSLDFACAKLRLTRVPLNPRLSAREQAQMLSGARASVLIFGPDLQERAGELAAMLPALHLVCLGAGSAAPDLLRLSEDESGAPPDRMAEETDIVLALYTSGTTGSLKAAQHTQRSWAAVALNILGNLVDVQPGDIMLHAASLMHASGTFILPYWIRGAVAVVQPNFAPAAYCNAVERYCPTAVNLVPTMIGMLLDTPGIEERNFSSVQTIIYGASPMPRATLQRGIALWGPRFVQYYGQSEAPLCISVLSKLDHLGPGSDSRLLSCGRVSSDCELKLIDTDGADVAEGATGEIVVRAPFGMVGYLEAEELNAQTMMAGGWIKTRDIGRLDAAGYLYLVDRTSDMIVSGGYNVYPREVEDVLAAHPGVREVVVVGLPHELWGEAVTAFVVIRENQSVTAADLIAFARANLAAYKSPKDVRFIDAIPRSAVGKLLRRAVRDPFWAGRERKV